MFEFGRVWHSDFLYKLNSCGISGYVFHLVLSFLSNRQLAVVLAGKSPQEYLANACTFQGCVLGLLIFLHHINNPPDDVVCNTAIQSSNTTLYSVDSVF